MSTTTCLNYCDIFNYSFVVFFKWRSDESLLLSLESRVRLTYMAPHGATLELNPNKRLKDTRILEYTQHTESPLAILVGGWMQ